MLRKRNGRLIRGRAWRATSLAHGELSAHLEHRRPLRWQPAKKQWRNYLVVPRRIIFHAQWTDWQLFFKFKEMRAAPVQLTAAQEPLTVSGARQIKLDRLTSGFPSLKPTKSLTHHGIFEKDNLKYPTIGSRCVKGQALRSQKSSWHHGALAWQARGQTGQAGTSNAHIQGQIQES